MSKIVQYLNSNLVGEILTTPVVRLNYSRDRSVLRIVPDAVIFPRQTDDVRKVAKLTYQLAEKGKTIGLTARGRGHSQTGAAIGPDFVIDFNRYLNRIIDIDPSQGLIHVQTGAELPKIEALAQSHNLRLPFDATKAQTVGGVFNSNNAVLDWSKIKSLAETIDQLEVVLANGDVIQTKKISKRELDKKLGLTTFEGDIYRKIDKIIEENAELISKIDTSRPDNMGYHTIALVKSNHGFDLTPLFIGAQGTLGFISEAILKLDATAAASQIVAASFLNIDDALDASEKIAELKPVYCQIYHSDIFVNAIESGKSFSFYDQAYESFAQVPAVCLLIRIDEKNARSLKRISKKLEKIIKGNKGFSVISDKETLDQLQSIRDIPHVFSDGRQDAQNVSLINGIQVPIFHFRNFAKGLEKISRNLNMSLPYYGSCLSGIMNIQTELNLKSVADKQKVFRLLSAVSKLTQEIGGILCASDGEGRLKTPFVHQTTNPDFIKLFKEIRSAFDPQGTLNRQVKEPLALKELASALVNDYYNGIFC